MSDDRKQLNNEDESLFDEDIIDIEDIGDVEDIGSIDEIISIAGDETAYTATDVYANIGSVDEIIASVYYDEFDAAGGNEIYLSGETEADFSPDVVRTLDDALRAADNSGLMPAPASERPIVAVPVERPSSSRQIVDKYGLPVNPPGSNMQNTPDGIVPVNYAIATGLADDLISAGTPEQGAFAPNALMVTPPVAAPNVPVPPAQLPGYRPKPPDNDDDDIPEFKIKFDFESAYRDPPNNNPLRRRRERRTGLVGGIMLAVFILCAALVLASAMWLAATDILGFSGEDESVDVVVPEGFVIDDVTDMLYEAGIIRYKSLFNIFAEYSKAEEKISPGQYVLNKSFDYRALVQGMTARAGVRVETTVVIPEGFTLAQIFKLLDEAEVCAEEDLWETATYHDFNFYFLSKETLGNRLRLEGFLFPDTYNFYKGSTAQQAIIKMLRQFYNKFTEQYIERADYLGYTVGEIVTIASMIEREAGSDEERSRIAAVIYNRLNNSANFPMLEIDATIRYAIAGTSIPFSTQVDSPYNTYTHRGLPPGPIANPGIASIHAALYPLNTNEYFYALHYDGTHRFFRNASDHRDFVNSDEYGG